MSEDFPVSIDTDFGTAIKCMIAYPERNKSYIIIDDESEKMWKDIVKHLEKAQQIYWDYIEHTEE